MFRLCHFGPFHLWVYLNSKPQRIHFSTTEFLLKCVKSLSPKLHPFLSFGVLPRASIFSEALQRKTIQRQLDSIERVDEYLIIGKSPPAKCELPVANIVLQLAGKGGSSCKEKQTRRKKPTDFTFAKEAGTRHMPKPSCVWIQFQPISQSRSGIHLLPR